MRLPQIIRTLNYCYPFILKMRPDPELGNHNSTSPWNAYLAKSINSNPLYGNLRSLQKLALLIMAWKDIGENEAIKKAVSIWNGNQTSEENFVESKLGIGTRDERINWFKNRLAIWAKDTYGTWEKSARELNCDEKNLRIDAVRKETILLSLTLCDQGEVVLEID